MDCSCSSRAIPTSEFVSTKRLFSGDGGVSTVVAVTCRLLCQRDGWCFSGDGGVSSGDLVPPFSGATEVDTDTRHAHIYTGI